ncbi:TPA: glycosyltransferase family 2 protein [Klebsiella quasipneumoniae subsp. similipneumoniae]
MYKKIKKVIKDFYIDLYRMIFTNAGFNDSRLNRLDFDKHVLNNQIIQFKEKEKLKKISAVIRVKNGAEYIESSVLSILSLVSEIVIIDNDSSDDTYNIATRLKKELSDICEINIYTYHKKLEIAGCGYRRRLNENPGGSLAAYYNYCFSLAKYDYVMKWDAHAIMFEKTINKIQAVLAKEPDAIYLRALELYGKNMSSEMRIYKSCLGLKYIDGDLYEELDFENFSFKEMKKKVLYSPAYLHLKRLSYVKFSKMECSNIVSEKYN